jgi:AcrR family transcriptional regulator
MLDAEDTETRILQAFLGLVAERGINATTTRAVAEAAGVNEVTIFRRFGDKANLAREAIRRLRPALDEVSPRVDATTPAAAAAGVVAILRMLWEGLSEHPELLQFGLAEGWRMVELRSEIEVAPLAALDLVRRTLGEASPQLRPEVDQDATALTLLGLVMLSSIWRRRDWLQLDQSGVDGLLERAVRPLFRSEGVSV